MCAITSPSRTLSIPVLLFSVCLATAIASEQASKPKALQLNWELAIADSREGPSQQLPKRILQTVNGEFIAAGSRIVRLDRRGPGDITLLNTKALILDAALDSHDNVWVGGRINQRAWFPGADMADAYLGKFSQNGKKLAEFTFGALSWRQIVALHPTRDDGILVTGPKNGGTWVARISGQGKISWEKTFGFGANAAVTEGHDGNIAFLGLRKAASASDKYEEEAVFWLLDPRGNVLGEQVIRPSINAHRSTRYENIAIEASPDGYFALAQWSDPYDDKPLTVAKVSLTGVMQWNISLKHTATPWPGRASAVWKKCQPRQAVLGNGDLLVTCSIEGEIVLSRLNGNSGTEKIQRVALPSCHENRPAVITPFPVKGNSVLLFGSRPSNNVATSCSWLAEWGLEP